MKPVFMKNKDIEMWINQGEIEPLSTRQGNDGAYYSAWAPSLKERIEFLFGAKVWVGVRAHPHPPISVSICQSVFQDDKS